jgi:L-ascorbate metabolism protein UlaG (beta-lactamase superfamily)
MRIVHYGHACVVLETEKARVLLDPGVFSEGFDAERELDAVLITHQHFDHLDEKRLPSLLQANPRARLYADPGSAETLRKLRLEHQVVRPGETLELADTTVSVVGGQHAVIHAELPLVRNVGYVFDDGAFYHPGDSLFVPEQKIDVLGLPTGAPWLKASEAVDFMRLVAPRVAIPIHEAVLANPGMHYGLFTNLAPDGTEVLVPSLGKATKLS